MKYALMNKEGELLTEFIYTEISSDFENGLTIAEINDSKGLIDQSGKQVLGFVQPIETILGEE